MAVENDIMTSKKLIESNIFMKRFTRIYPFPTENVPGCFENYSFKDKDCLTVLGSSAQAFYMYFKGASSVTTFDINGLTIYYFYFIKAFIMSQLNHKDLLRLFTSVKKEESDIIYSTISCYLIGDYRVYWDTLYKLYGNRLFNLMSLFMGVEGKVAEIEEYSGYLNENTFKKLRKIINKLNPTFINCNIKNLSEFITDYYDFMYFSNIASYASEIFKTSSQEQALIEYKSLLLELTTHLSGSGEMYCSYIYEIGINKSQHPLFDKITRETIFYEPNYSYVTFDAFNPRFEKGLDACLVYKKTIKRRK